MTKVKIVFNAHGSENIGSVRIPMYGIRSEFDNYVDFHVAHNDFNNYQNYDVAILHADDDEVSIARDSNPNIIIGLVKPHHERVVNVPLEKINLKSFLYQLRLFVGDKNSRFIKERNCKIVNSDFVIADSLYLKSLFESEGHDAVYIKLIEKYNVKPIVLSKKNNKSIVFGYHGNYRHFIESKSYIFPALEELSKTFDVTLKVVSNLQDFDCDNDSGFDVKYFNYNFPGIYDVLQDIDIGLVPNQIQYRSVFFDRLFTRFGCLFWNTDKYHDVLFRFKQSSNAGRAFIFSQLAKPFIGCPTPEVVSIFGSVLEEYLPFDKKTWKHCIIKLANDERKRIEISNELIDKVNKSINTKIEADKLRIKIMSLIDKKNLEV